MDIIGLVALGMLGMIMGTGSRYGLPATFRAFYVSKCIFIDGLCKRKFSLIAIPITTMTRHCYHQIFAE